MASALDPSVEFRLLEPEARGTWITADGFETFRAKVVTAEEPGRFCFPALAATITGVARLMLALVQANLEAMGGSYVGCDTDSLLVVASEADGVMSRGWTVSAISDSVCAFARASPAPPPTPHGALHQPRVVPAGQYVERHRLFALGEVLHVHERLVDAVQLFGTDKPLISGDV